MMASKPNNGRDNSNDHTEYFARPDNGGSTPVSGTDRTEYIPRSEGYGDQDYGYGYNDSYGYEDETRTYQQQPQETEFFDRPAQQPNNQAPRQQFPEGYDPVSGTYAPGYGPDARRQQEVAYQQPPAQPQYQQPQRRESRPKKKKSGGGGFIALGFLLGLALLAAIAFFLLWRNSESAPAPTPVTETATVTQTVEPTPSREPLLPTEIPTQLPELPSDIIPTELPNIELPSDVQNFDIEGFINDLVGGQGQPAAPAQ